jgi:Neprosin
MADSLQNFNEFVQSLSSARPEQFSAAPGAKVESPAAFEAMRQYLLNRYQGLETQHSFVENGGQIVDCIPIEQQPSLRGSSQRIPTAPSLPQSPPQSYPPPDFAVRSQRPPPQLSPDYRDRFGNQMSCPQGTIPLIRLTLEQLSRFRNLQDFFQKAPGGGRLPTGIEKESRTVALHKYAHANQFVNNIGGTAYLNVWKPVIGPNQVFSLSQHWYVGGSGNGIQTAECGWQVFPQMYGTDLPCLFIYWTRDNYFNSGCYNVSCDAFVQTDSSVVLGGGLTFSTPGPNTQFEYQMGYLFSGGNWWFYFNNQPIGYYPGSLYQGGALSNGAAIIDFGGETVGDGTWPPMGSGAFANGGFGVAAYTRSIGYFPPSGGTVDAALSQQQPSPQCYTIDVFNSSGTSWGSYIFFSGPGGTNC